MSSQWYGPPDDQSIWESGYEQGYEDGAADVWASLHDEESEIPDLPDDMAHPPPKEPHAPRHPDT